jgi:protein-tyrosine-phosphatase
MSTSEHTKKVLFVCLGNICRSPMAEAVFAHMVKERGLADQFYIDSAGTSGWHVCLQVVVDTKRNTQLTSLCSFN